MRYANTGGLSASGSPNRAGRLLAQGKNVYLAGFMGTGKSVVARSLARRLGAAWVDTDALIEREADMSIAEIFRTGGERAFRATEHRVLRRVTREGGRVVALGGGAVCFPRNREVLRGTGPVVVLTAPPEVIWRRVRHAGGRPLLAGDGGYERMRTLLEGRRADYRRYRLRVDTEHLRPSGVAAAVVAVIEGTARARRPQECAAHRGEGGTCR